MATTTTNGVARDIWRTAVCAAAAQARADLEALAKSYTALRLVRDEAEGLVMAIQARPDLYAAFCQPAQDTGASENPERELQRLAREYVVKRVESSEQDGMVRAIREHPELYEAHRRRVQRQRQAGQAVDVRKVVR